MVARARPFEGGESAPAEAFEATRGGRLSEHEDHHRLPDQGAVPDLQ